MKKRRNFTIQNHNEHRKLTIVRPNQQKNMKPDVENQPKTHILNKIASKQFLQSKNGLEERAGNKIQKIGVSISSNMRRSSLDFRILSQKNSNQKFLHPQANNQVHSYSRPSKQRQTLLLKDIIQKYATSFIDDSNSFINQDLDLMINELCKLLIHQMFLFQSSSVTYIIKKEKLHQLIKCVACVQLQGKKQHIKKPGDVADSYEDVIYRIGRYINAIKLQEQVKKMKLISKTTVFNYNSVEYYKEKQSKIKQLSELNASKSLVENQITKLRDIVGKIKQEFEELIKKKIQQQRSSYQLKRNNQNEAQKFLLLKNQVNLVQTEFLTIKKREEDIFNFVTKQENKRLLKEISKEYKDIQSDIYQYAVYLQSNEMATNPDFQPHPFAQIEKRIMQEVKASNKTIIQNDELNLAQKQKVMRDIVVKTVQHYHKKDLEMSKLGEFKTKCIREFVNKMKKWLNNWELKQQFLVNLRKQFAEDSNQMNLKIKELQSFSSCGVCRNGIDAMIFQLTKCFGKIQQNYKMGNSFY